MPGRPVTSPAAFSVLPATLSATFSVLVRGFLTVLVRGPAVLVVAVLVVVVLGLATRPVVTLEVRGLLVLALVLVVVVVRFLGATTFSICWTIRGLEFPRGSLVYIPFTKLCLSLCECMSH